jgi:outer membrane protein assembly factor BamA
MSARLTTLGLTVLVACGGGQRRVHHPGDEYLAEIRIVGVTADERDLLLPRLALHRTQEAERSIDEYQLQLDTQRITGALQKRGYFAVDVRPSIERHGDAATLTFTVVEGARATTRVELVGLPADIPLATARTLIELADGAPFDYDAFDAAKAPIQRLVEDAGYARTHIDASVIADRVHATATVRFVIDPGARCTFGSIEVRGADGVLADAARARLKFSAGDRYSTTQVDATRQALYAMGRFGSVRVEPDRTGDATTIAVVVTVTENPPNELRLGGGAGLDPLTYSVRLRGQYSRVGVITPLTTLNVDLRPEYATEADRCGFDLWNCKADPRIRLLGVLTQQDLLWTDVKGDVEGGLDYLTFEAYTRAGGHGRLGLAMPLATWHLQLRVGWQVTATSFPDVFVDAATASRLQLDRDNLVGAYTAAAVLDFRDQPIEPTKGFYVEMRAAKGTRYALGSFDYLQLAPEARAFYPIGPTVLSARVRVGRLTGDVPVTERFYGGGTASQRGFSPRRLSPVAPSADGMTSIVIGGAGLIESSVELRAPLGTIYGIDLGGVVFVDGGDVTETASAIDPWHQHAAVGVGLRWMSPIGPVGIDLAYRLNRTGAGEPEPGRHWNPLLAVGEAF